MEKVATPDQANEAVTAAEGAQTAVTEVTNEPEPTATPSPTPTAEPTQEPTAEPTAEPTTQPTAEPEVRKGLTPMFGGDGAWIALLAATLILGAATALLIMRMGKINAEIRKISTDAVDAGEETVQIDTKGRR